MEYTNALIKDITERQRDFFRSGVTLETDWRIVQLKRLKVQMTLYEKEITEALAEDLGRSEAEAFFCDIGTVILEINEMIEGLKRWAKPDLLFSGLTCFPSLFTKVYHKPYGVSLIISPFNFPFTLTFGVLAASIAGGNTAVIKTSSKTPHCTDLMMKMISEIYPEEYITVIGGGHDVADMCLDQRFDKIFYTGSPAVAKHVMAKAAENLTPVALELGGETGNWCIVRRDADLADAARKIAFFKLCNSGQICININQVAVAEEVAEEFLKELKSAFVKQIGEDALLNPEYPRKQMNTVTASYSEATAISSAFATSLPSSIRLKRMSRSCSMSCSHLFFRSFLSRMTRLTISWRPLLTENMVSLSICSPRISSGQTKSWKHSSSAADASTKCVSI